MPKKKKQPDAKYFERVFRQSVALLRKPGEDVKTGMSWQQADALHCVLGISSEAGELADAIKKWSIYGKNLDRANVVEELGDMEFYLEGLRQCLGITRTCTLAGNVKKLRIRYPDKKYSNADAIAREDKRGTCPR